MAAISNYLENKLLDHVLRNTAYTAPSTVYVALFTSSASLAELEAGTLTNEVTGGSYSRKTVSFEAAANGATQNVGDISFSNMPDVTVGFAAVMDAATAGNVLFKGALNQAKTLDAGDTFTIAAGNLDITLD